MGQRDVVLTGVGIVCPIGIGNEAVWDSLCSARSGVGPIRSFDASGLPVRIAAEIDAFDPKEFVKPRKRLKVMCRDAQLGVAASLLASRDAGISPGDVDPERFGVVLGADAICSEMRDCEGPYRNCLVRREFRFDRWGSEGMADTFPLSFLKLLPNMIASHVSIVHDARGPNNTIHQNDTSGLSAVIEAARVIQRGAADVMIAGAASSLMKPLDWVRHCLIDRLSLRQDDPATVLRPFGAGRDGQVWGEGAAAFVLESRRHAEARGAVAQAKVLAWASTSEPTNGSLAGGKGLRWVMAKALGNAGLSGADLGHVNAHAASLVSDDRIEARAICDLLNGVPVTAPKSYFGNLGAAGGAVEMALSVLSFRHGLVPPTLNYWRPSPDCPVRIIRGEPLCPKRATALALNWTRQGQAVALVLAADD